MVIDLGQKPKLRCTLACTQPPDANRGSAEMNLIMNDPAAWGSILALTVLCVAGVYYIIKFVKGGHH